MEPVNGRIGFCCKWLSQDYGLPPDPKAAGASRDARLRRTSEYPMNQGSVTLKKLSGLTPAEQEKTVVMMAERNVTTLMRQLEWISRLPHQLRMFRITSDFVPASVHPDYEWIHRGHMLEEVLEPLEGVREFCAEHGIRLGTHPGQFTNMSSVSERTVDMAAGEIEHHARMAERMGYGGGWHPDGFSINVHANIGQDPKLEFFTRRLNMLGETARNLLTVENDEFGCGLDEILASELPVHVPVVLDIHHHWVRTGEYIMPDDKRIEHIIASWRGTPPLSHASFPESGLSGAGDGDILPDHSEMIKKGTGKGKMRTHAPMPWGKAAMTWVCGHLKWTDIEIEAGGKNLASRALYDFLRNMQENHG